MVIIKFANTRIDLRNKTTYVVAKKVDKDTREVRYAIFFNLIGGGYRELVAFATKEEAEYVANVIDTIEADNQVYIKDGETEGYFYVFDATTGVPVFQDCEEDDTRNTLHSDRHYINAGWYLVDLTDLIEYLEFTPVNMKECE